MIRGLDYGVYHFRKNFSLNEVPKEFIIHVSADNRYRLFVNGEPVCFGPARGDLMHWRYESIDISAYLKTGENTLGSRGLELCRPETLGAAFAANGLYFTGEF
jgi:hypothetical protein